MAERWIEELDLTEEQVTQIRAIREGSQDEMQALHDQLRAEREVMHTLMSGTATDDELRSQHQKVQALHQEVGDQRFENMLAVRAVLTPEQRAELGDRMEQRREQFRQNRQERRQQRVQ
jgi:Spy/CpxP family protein refolding chaperone